MSISEGAIVILTAVAICLTAVFTIEVEAWWKARKAEKKRRDGDA